MRKRYKKTPITDLLGFPIGYECREKGIKILQCEKAAADAIIIKNHYSHKVTENSFLVYYHGKVSGALQLGYGIRPKIKKVGDDTNSTREFDRMWLSDEMPKFSETITLSLLHHFLREAYEFPHCCIATFSKMDLFQAPQLREFRSLFPYAEPKSLFISHSKEWGLKGSFPIAFSVWR